MTASAPAHRRVECDDDGRFVVVVVFVFVAIVPTTEAGEAPMCRRRSHALAALTGYSPPTPRPNTKRHPPNVRNTDVGSRYDPVVVVVVASSFLGNSSNNDDVRQNAPPNIRDDVSIPPRRRPRTSAYLPMTTIPETTPSIDRRTMAS